MSGPLLRVPPPGRGGIPGRSRIACPPDPLTEPLSLGLGSKSPSYNP